MQYSQAAREYLSPFMQYSYSLPCCHRYRKPRLNQTAHSSMLQLVVFFSEEQENVWYDRNVLWNKNAVCLDCICLSHRMLHQYCMCENDLCIQSTFLSMRTYLFDQMRCRFLHKWMKEMKKGILIFPIFCVSFMFFYSLFYFQHITHLLDKLTLSSLSYSYIYCLNAYSNTGLSISC